MPTCYICRRDLTRSEFSKNQLSRSAESRRCLECVRDPNAEVRWRQHFADNTATAPAVVAPASPDRATTSSARAAAAPSQTNSHRHRSASRTNRSINRTTLAIPYYMSSEEKEAADCPEESYDASEVDFLPTNMRERLEQYLETHHTIFDSSSDDDDEEDEEEDSSAAAFSSNERTRMKISNLIEFLKNDAEEVGESMEEEMFCAKCGDDLTTDHNCHFRAMIMKCGHLICYSCFAKMKSRTIDSIRTGGIGNERLPKCEVCNKFSEIAFEVPLKFRMLIQYVRVASGLTAHLSGKWDSFMENLLHSSGDGSTKAALDRQRLVFEQRERQQSHDYTQKFASLAAHCDQQVKAEQERSRRSTEESQRNLQNQHQIQIQKMQREIDLWKKSSQENTRHAQSRVGKWEEYAETLERKRNEEFARNQELSKSVKELKEKLESEKNRADSEVQAIDVKLGEWKRRAKRLKDEKESEKERNGALSQRIRDLEHQLAAETEKKTKRIVELEQETANLKKAPPAQANHIKNEDIGACGCCIILIFIIFGMASGSTAAASGSSPRPSFGQ